MIQKNNITNPPVPHRYLKSAVALLLVCMCMWHAVPAQDKIRISNAWINEAPPGVKMMGGYLSISNKTSQSLVLIGVTSPCFEKIEFHVTEIKDGVSSMRKHEFISIPAGSEFSFSPGHYHLMLINQTRTLTADDTVPITLHFKGGDLVQVIAEVRRGETPSHQHH